MNWSKSSVLVSILPVLEDEQKRTRKYSRSNVFATVSIAALLLVSVIALALEPIIIGERQFASASTFPGVNGKIAFNRSSSVFAQIYVMNPDGSVQTQLTDSPNANDGNAEWSPDGTKIIFNSDRDDPSSATTSHIYVMNADGSNQTRLTSGPTYDFAPSWSPDGLKIVFNCQTAICVIKSDGTELKQVTDRGAYPTWSPDGTKIAFEGRIAGDWGIFVMNQDGSSKTRLTTISLDEGQDRGASWSPDGTKIAFNRLVSKPGPPICNCTLEAGSNIYVVGADGSNLRKLSPDDPSRDYNPAWSPDGTKIVFEIVPPPQLSEFPQLYVMNADGSGRTSLGSEGYNPAWGTSPPSPPPKQSTLTIDTVDLAGKPLSGIWTVIRAASDGTIVKTGFTPLSFTGNSETEYKVSVANYDGKIFQHWDNANTSNVRTINLAASGTAIKATYDTGDSLKGFAPLTFTGTTEQPDLTVNALSMDGNNNTLHMWTVIDPQSSDASSPGATTYRVYATNGYQNYAFDHWGDDGSTDRFRTLAIDKATTLTAFYKKE